MSTDLAAVNRSPRISQIRFLLPKILKKKPPKQTKQKTSQTTKTQITNFFVCCPFKLIFLLEGIHCNSEEDALNKDTCFLLCFLFGFLDICLISGKGAFSLLKLRKFQNISCDSAIILLSRR